MPLQATSGAASYDAFGGGVPVVPTYIEDVFSTWLHTGTGANQTITNGVDLAGKGGLVWFKNRGAVVNHAWFDTARGTTVGLSSNLTSGNITTWSNSFTSFNSNGFTVGADTATVTNASSNNYVSWTFREQSKFFDIVTYEGNGANRTIAHALGSVPGCILVKRINGTGNWAVYHRSTGSTHFLSLNAQSQANPSSAYWNNTDPTSSVFTVGTDANVNGIGSTYIAYIFAHNAGGFGLSGSDNVISCGTFTTDGSGNATVDLGYEPQWVMMKRSVGSGAWMMFDNMRGMPVPGVDAVLRAESSVAESSPADNIDPTSTGFLAKNLAVSVPYIYIAIRRGPMRTPTSGTSVFSPTLGFAGIPGFQTSWPVDASIAGYRPGDANYPNIGSRLTGTGYLVTPSTAVEATNSLYTWDYMNGWVSSNLTTDYIGWNFRRAPGFFDVVCYTGTGSARTVAHNLGVAPELMIVKARSLAANWQVYSAALGNASRLILASSAGAATPTTVWNNTTPTASVFSVDSAGVVNGSGNTYVAYLFASCSGVSRVGSYTGTGATQVINCGFTGGARFVLIKATSTTGDWYVWDSARGIVAGNDPYLALNSTAAEVTNTDWVDTAASGFELSNAGGNLANSNGVSYIFLAIS